jgi:hypothetical protein
MMCTGCGKVTALCSCMKPPGKLVVEVPDLVAPIAADPVLIGRNAARLAAKVEETDEDAERAPPRRTVTLGPVATKDLLERLRPLVYASGQCSDCNHSEEEKLAIGDALLSWWTLHDIDETDSGRTD